jgi:hypothetical protein
MDKISCDIDDVEFILGEIIKFASMEPQALFAFLKDKNEDALCSVPHPSRGGGILICGREAFRRFYFITERLLKTLGDSASDYDDNDVYKKIINNFSKNFIKVGVEINKNAVQSFLSTALKQSRKNHKELIHYIPCVVVHEEKPERFNIGIVEFIRTETFLRENEDKFLKYVDETSEFYRRIWEENSTNNKENKDEIVNDARNKASIFVTELNEYFSDHKWVAKVAIPKCDTKVSRERAEIVINSALDIIKLFFKELHGKGLRLGHDVAVPRKVANLTSDVEEGQKFDISYGWRGADGTYAGDKWYEELTKPRVYPYITGAASALDVRISPKNKMHLKERLLDALSWYGQATSDTLPSTKIVKYVAAWERLVITKKEKDLTSTVCKRIAIFAHETYRKSFQETSRDAKEVYNWRSNLMHGTSSPFTLNIDKNVPIAEKMTQAAIFHAIDIFICLSHRIKNPQPRDLEEEYLRIEKKFLEDLNKIDLGS